MRDNVRSWLYLEARRALVRRQLEEAEHDQGLLHKVLETVGNGIVQ